MSGNDDTQTFRFKRGTHHAFARIDGGDCKTVSEVVCRIKNFKNVAKLGESLRKQIDGGDNRIVFASTNYHDSQKKAVFALGCYLADILSKQRVLVLTSGKEGDALKFFEFADAPSIKPLEKTTVYEFGDNLAIMDLQEILTSGGHNRDEVLTTALEAIEQYDVVLWSAPPMQVMRQYLPFYHRLLHSFKAMNLVVSRHTMTTGDVNEVKEFFESHGISLKGAMFSSPNLKDGDDK